MRGCAVCSAKAQEVEVRPRDSLKTHFKMFASRGMISAVNQMPSFIHLSRLTGSVRGGVLENREEVFGDLKEEQVNAKKIVSTYIYRSSI